MVLLSPALADEDAPRAILVAEPAAETAAQPGAGQVMSRSEQFRVVGGPMALRSTFAILAEQTKHDLLKLTAGRDGWKVPVRVQLHGVPGEPAPERTLTTRVLDIEGLRELRIDAHVGRGVEVERFKRAVIGALLYEQVLRDPALNTAESRLDVPPWLSDGLGEAIAWSQDLSDRRIYQELFRQGGWFSLDNLFAKDEAGFDDMDGATRVAFRVSAGALVMALLEQPEGRDGFRSFLAEAPVFEGEMPGLLSRHFPSLNLSETSLAKWWQLQLANKGGLNHLAELLDIPRTEALLADALKLHSRDPEGIFLVRDLAEWPDLAELEETARVEAVKPAEDALVRLSYRCFPSYRPILREYQSVLLDIARNRTRDVGRRLGELDEARTLMLAKSGRARDYLDWFEITRARETSGAFDDYLRLKDRLKSRPRDRRDPLSLYLDRLDEVFHRAEPQPGVGLGSP